MRKKLFSGLLVALFVLAAGGASTPRTEAADLSQRRSPPTPAQLKDLHTRTLGLFENPQVVFTDVDEQTNRLTVGVEQAGAAAAVRQRLPSLGVPTDLMDVVVTPPIVQMATLRDRVRPLVGGLQIHFGKFLCTLGFNGVRAGVNGFVENSHCTDKQGGVRGSHPYARACA